MAGEKLSLIDNFVRDENSICREERQYALYLYNALLAYHNAKTRSSDVEDIVKIIFGIEECDDLVIDNVFYEATFMRDLHEYNKRCCFNKKNSEKNDELYRYKSFSVQEYSIDAEAEADNSFNWKLFCYLEKNRDKLYSGKVKTEEELDSYFLKAKEAIKGLREEYHLGQSKNFITDENIIKQDIRSMMNAKPDVAVIYHDSDNKKYLLFLECKFQSGEGKNGIRPQTHIQYMIADFLCSNWLVKGGKERKLTINNQEFGCDISPLMDGGPKQLGKAVKVVFYRNFGQDSNDTKKDIIKDAEKNTEKNTKKNTEKNAAGANADSNSDKGRQIDINKLIKINNEIFGMK